MSKKEVIKVVEEVYLEILKRPADKVGLDHYVSRILNINDPLDTKEELVAIFKLSDEYKNKPTHSLNSIATTVNSLIDGMSFVGENIGSAEIFTYGDFSADYYVTKLIPGVGRWTKVLEGEPISGYKKRPPIRGPPNGFDWTNQGIFKPYNLVEIIDNYFIMTSLEMPFGLTTVPGFGDQHSWRCVWDLENCRYTADYRFYNESGEVQPWVYSGSNDLKGWWKNLDDPLNLNGNPKSYMYFSYTPEGIIKMKKLVDEGILMTDVSNSDQFIKIANESRPSVQLSNIIEKINNLEQRIKDLEKY
tara:strand:+ start:325 stop:1233 length:909 start_codon:yes stop_codon:yes gene_type:complete